MKELTYTDETGAVGAFQNVLDVQTGKLKLKGFHVAEKNTFLGNYLVNIIENLDGSFRLIVNVPPEPFTICCHQGYSLEDWQSLTYYQAKYLAHCFIAKKRLQRINEYKKYSFGYRMQNKDNK